MKITHYPPETLISAEYNPRQLSKDQYKHLTDSVKRFGLVDPIIVNNHKDRKGIVIGGHQRLKIANELGFKEIPCIEVNLTYDKERELNIRLNQNTGDWDYETLANNFDMDELLDWGFTEKDLNIFGEDDFYSKKIGSVLYEPNDHKPEPSELYNNLKTKTLIQSIEDNKNLSDEEKEFLISASQRHIVFNYSKIADFYSGSSDEVKKLMEDSALVIVDYDRAIELGYTNLTDDIIDAMDKDYA